MAHYECKFMCKRTAKMGIKLHALFTLRRDALEGHHFATIKKEKNVKTKIVMLQHCLSFLSERREEETLFAKRFKRKRERERATERESKSERARRLKARMKNCNSRDWETEWQSARWEWKWKKNSVKGRNIPAALNSKYVLITLVMLSISLYYISIVTEFTTYCTWYYIYTGCYTLYLRKLPFHRAAERTRV